MSDFDAGKAVRRKYTEDSLAAALNRNTREQEQLREAVRTSVEAQIERLDMHARQMEELRRLQTGDLDRQLKAMGETKKEMELGRHALNDNTETMKRLCELLEKK
jgi:hypothetical protein